MAWSYTLATDSPDGSVEVAATLDDYIRLVKQALIERLDTDLYFPLTGTQVSNTSAGKHRKVQFYGVLGTKPTLAAGECALYIKTVSGKSELFFENQDGTEKQLTTVGALNIESTDLLGRLANDTYLTAVDAAGTGTVNLIKANASDAAQLPDSSQLATDAAPTTDAQIANKKYVDDTPHTNGIVQQVHTQTGAFGSGTAIIPYDDTIPQSSEGTEFMTLAITPTSASNILFVEVVANLYCVNAYNIIGALFQDATANALAAGIANSPTYGHCQIVIKYKMTAGTVAATTFKFRAGPTTLNATGLNGDTSRKLGGVMCSSITITEIKV